MNSIITAPKGLESSQARVNEQAVQIPLDPNPRFFMNPKRLSFMLKPGILYRIQGWYLTKEV